MRGIKAINICDWGSGRACREEAFFPRKFQGSKIYCKPHAEMLDYQRNYHAVLNEADSGPKWAEALRGHK